MASVHFPSIAENAKRIVQMGEDPMHVFPVGALGIDNVMHIPLMTEQELADDLKIDFKQDVVLVTYHPVTLEGKEASVNQIRIVLDALLQTKLYLLITMPNCDVGGEEIDCEIKEYQKKYADRITYVTSLGQRRYLSVLKYAKIALGNSSSGIIETASFLLPTVDIGSRQKGRFAPRNVIHCECNTEEIIQSISIGLSDEFQRALVGYQNPYGDGHTAERIAAQIKMLAWDRKAMCHKSFYTLKFDYK